MGVMIDGVWHVEEPADRHQNGRFSHPESVIRNWVTPDGAPGPTGTGGFKAEAGRYHLYICHACPWAQRTMIFRALKGLEEAISVSVVNLFKGDDGWTFEDGDGVVPDPVFGAHYLREIYQTNDPAYTGRVYLMFDANLTQDVLAAVWDAIEESSKVGAIVDTRMISRDEGVQMTLDLGANHLDVGAVKERMPGSVFTAIAEDRLRVSWPSPV